MLEIVKIRIVASQVGLLGALVALAFESSSEMESLLMYILPFTAGGFLNIALVSVLPELMQVGLHHDCGRCHPSHSRASSQPYYPVTTNPQEKRPWPALGQFVCLVAGIGAMGLLTML